MEKAFEIINLNKSYKGFSLKNVNLTLPKGYIMGFVGANGAGKSTTIGCLLNMVKADSGSIKILGRETAKLTAADKEKLGVVMDGCPFAEVFNVMDIKKVISNIYKTFDDEQFEKLIKKFNLPKDKQIKEFSTGMRAKLNIAVALSHKAELLVLDEATSGLDPVVRDEILDILLEFVQDENKSIFISSHITSDLEKICDYIAFIKNGEIIFVENKDELKDKYALIHCTKQQFEEIDPSAVVGTKQTEFNVSALVFKEAVKEGVVAEKPSIEDIMLYSTKEAK